jgi:hypothetical protein
MTSERQKGEFPEQAEENRRIWDVNARWWDDRIGDGNDFQTLLIEPATERLVDVHVRKPTSPHNRPASRA